MRLVPDVEVIKWRLVGMLPHAGVSNLLGLDALRAFYYDFRWQIVGVMSVVELRSSELPSLWATCRACDRLHIQQDGIEVEMGEKRMR